jgi:hypothetical protein
MPQAAHVVREVSLSAPQTGQSTLGLDAVAR